MQDIRYSKQPFEGYTHRFSIRFITVDSNSLSLDLYSNSDSFEKLEEFIELNKRDKVYSFRIEHRTSKKEDELLKELIEETLQGL